MWNCSFYVPEMVKYWHFHIVHPNINMLLSLRKSLLNALLQEPSIVTGYSNSTSVLRGSHYISFLVSLTTLPRLTSSSRHYSNVGITRKRQVPGQRSRHVGRWIGGWGKLAGAGHLQSPGIWRRRRGHTGGWWLPFPRNDASFWCWRIDILVGTF